MTSRPTSSPAMTETTLVVAAETRDDFLGRMQETARRLDAGTYRQGPARLSFASMELLLETLTGNRWRLIKRLQHNGHSSIRALSRDLGRDYRGVHADVVKLLETGLVEKDEAGLVYVPWRKITAEINVEEAA
jgi:predicted transcriptional regulator